MIRSGHNLLGKPAAQEWRQGPRGCCRYNQKTQETGLNQAVLVQRTTGGGGGTWTEHQQGSSCPEEDREK